MAKVGYNPKEENLFSYLLGEKYQKLRPLNPHLDAIGIHNYIDGRLSYTDFRERVIVARLPLPNQGNGNIFDNYNEFLIESFRKSLIDVGEGKKLDTIVLNDREISNPRNVVKGRYLFELKIEDDINNYISFDKKLLIPGNRVRVVFSIE